MIKANELRIGNLIMGIAPQKVKGIGEAGIIIGSYFIPKSIDGNMCSSAVIEAVEVKDYLKYDQALPIGITPEILEKAGFEVHDYEPNTFIKRYEKYDGYFLQLNGNKTFQPVYENPDGLCPAGKELRYVHELQNAYYSFTGEELEIAL